MTNPNEHVVQIEAGAVTASLEDRTITGLLLPYGEIGQTNIGRFSVDAGAIKIPADASVVTLNSQHKRDVPVGRAKNLQETKAGIVGTFKIAKTPEGDTALAEIASGKRSRLSAEFNVVLDRDHKAVSGNLFASALVEQGAFPSAAVYAEFHETAETPAPETDAHKAEKEEKESQPVTDEINAETATTVTPEALQTVAASIANPSTTFTPKPFGTKREVLAAMVRHGKGHATAEDNKLYDAIVAGPQPEAVFASLDVIPFSGSGSPAPYENIPQYIGELTEAVYGQTSFADLVGQGDLEKPTVSGFHFNALPTPGTGASSWSSPYAGNAAAVPTSLITTTPYTVNAKLFAGGIEAPREWAIFGVDETLLDAYYTRQAQNFGLFVDEGVFTTINAALTAIEADNPSGISIGAGWSALVDALFAVITQHGGVPTAAVVEPSLWKAMSKTSQVDALQYLTAQLGLQEGAIEGFKIRPDVSGSLATGNILAGNFRDGATLYTLPGAPLRFQALNIGAAAAIDTAVVGAAAVVLQQADCFALVEPYSA